MKSNFYSPIDQRGIATSLSSHACLVIGIALFIVFDSKQPVAAQNSKAGLSTRGSEDVVPTTTPSTRSQTKSGEHSSTAGQKSLKQTLREAYRRDVELLCDELRNAVKLEGDFLANARSQSIQQSLLTMIDRDGSIDQEYLEKRRTVFQRTESREVIERLIQVTTKFHDKVQAADGVGGEVLSSTKPAEKKATSQATSQPDSQGDERHTFRSFQQVLQSMPPELRLKKGGWDKFQREDVDKWFTSNAVGSDLSVSLRIAHISVRKDAKEDAWIVEIEVEPIAKEFKIADLTNRWVCLFEPNEDKASKFSSPKQHVRFTVDEATAKKWDKRNPGTVVAVKGSITKVSWWFSTYASKGYSFSVHLSEVKGLEILPK